MTGKEILQKCFKENHDHLVKQMLKPLYGYKYKNECYSCTYLVRKDVKFDRGTYFSYGDGEHFYLLQTK